MVGAGERGRGGGAHGPTHASPRILSPCGEREGSSGLGSRENWLFDFQYEEHYSGIITNARNHVIR